MTNTEFGAGFRAGQVIGRGLSTFFANIARFVPLMLAASLPGIVLALLLPVFPVDPALLNATNAADAMEVTGSSAVGGLAMIVVFMGCAMWISAGVTYGVVSHLRGRSAGGTEILVRSLSSVPRLLLLVLVAIPVVIVLILLNIILLNVIPVLGAIAFVVIVFWLYAMFWVAVPAIVVEGGGPIAGLGRSAQLTRGHRWSVLGVILLWTVLSLAIGLVLSLLLAGMGMAVSPLGGGAPSIVVVLIYSIVEAVLLGLGASVAAVGYHDLRIVKEGGGTGGSGIGNR
ncbi:MAG: hypothetical protein GDA49_06510 [Rhodospirillales bacterium]|nr:hypothetical protein [Rhodospirillales bacterium]